MSHPTSISTGERKTMYGRLRRSLASSLTLGEQTYGASSCMSMARSNPDHAIMNVSQLARFGLYLAHHQWLYHRRPIRRSSVRNEYRELESDADFDRLQSRTSSTTPTADPRHPSRISASCSVPRRAVQGNAPSVALVASLGGVDIAIGFATGPAGPTRPFAASMDRSLTHASSSASLYYHCYSSSLSSSRKPSSTSARLAIANSENDRRGRRQVRPAHHDASGDEERTHFNGRARQSAVQHAGRNDDGRVQF